MTLSPYMVPPDNPATWSWDQARAVLALPKDHYTNLDFYDGDHWQRGTGWSGPKLDPETGTIGDEVLDLIRTGFTSSNVIKEVVHRHRDAVVGHPVMWHGSPQRFVALGESPTDQELTQIRAMEAALTKWWDSARLQDQLVKATAHMLLAERGLIRVYVPTSALDTRTFTPEGQNPITVRGVAAANLDEAFRKIRIDAPSVKMAAVYTHPRTGQYIGIVRQAIDAVETIDLYYVRPNGLTEIRQVTLDGKGNVYTLPLGGRLPLIQATLVDGPLITEQVRQNQRALNLALSMIPRSAVTSGFLERIFLDAQPPGEWEYNAQGERVKFVPGAYRTGAGTTNFMQGTEFQDIDGKKIVKDPKVEFREPTDPKAPITAAMAHYGLILSETRQEHVLTNTEALMSGKSREQARAGFEASVRPTKTQCETLAAEVMQTALALAEAFIGEPGQFSETYRVITTCRVDTGPSAASEREQDNLSVKDHIMATETAMERAGVVDVDAELARISASPRYQLDLLLKQLEALGAAAEAGVPPEAIAEIMGMDKALITAIKKAREEAAAEAEAEAAAAARPARPQAA